MSGKQRGRDLGTGRARRHIKTNNVPTPQRKTRASQAIEAALSHPLVVNKRLRVTATSKVSLVIDFMWAVGNLAMGVFSKSFWLVTFGASYALVFALRLIMLLAVHRKNLRTLRASFVASGVLVGASVIMVVGMSTLAVTGKGGHGGSDIAVISTATYTFGSFGANIACTVSFRRTEDSLFGLKCIAVAKTLFSMLALEISMVLTFGGGQSASGKPALTIMTGALVAAGLAVISTVLIRRGRKMLLPR